LFFLAHPADVDSHCNSIALPSLTQFFHCPIGKCIAIDCHIDPGLPDARSVVSVLPEKLPGGIKLWQSANHHKSAYQAVGNQPLGNQPKTFWQSAILQTHLVTPMWSAISPSNLNDPPFSTHLIIQRGRQSVVDNQPRKDFSNLIDPPSL
jgi:hypothetical protein